MEVVLGIAADVVKGVARDKRLCVLVTLNVRNVFNSAPWYMIDDEVSGLRLPLYIRRLIRSYLYGRRILVQANENFFEKEMTCGVPQGSVLGLIL